MWPLYNCVVYFGIYYNSYIMRRITLTPSISFTFAIEIQRHLQSWLMHAIKKTVSIKSAISPINPLWISRSFGSSRDISPGLYTRREEPRETNKKKEITSREERQGEWKEERYPTRLPLLVVENLISIPSIQQLYRSLIFDKG